MVHDSHLYSYGILLSTLPTKTRLRPRPSPLISPAFNRDFALTLRSATPIHQTVSTKLLQFTFVPFFATMARVATRFTTAEDAEIIRLKEQVGGSWNAIQQAFTGVFPGTTRKHGDLQVRYTRALKPGEKYRAPALAALGWNGKFIHPHTLLITFFSASC
jgi:hypothetical protein